VLPIISDFFRKNKGKAYKKKNSTENMKIRILLLAIIAIIALYVINPEINIEDYLEQEKEIPEEFGSIDVYFCPEDECEQILIDNIMVSQNVKCALYDLDLENVSNALKSKNADVLIDEDNYEDYGKEIKGSGLMHNKFCILDDEKIITGSMNPTKRGTKKNNNNLIIIQSEYLAENYNDEIIELKRGEKRETGYPVIMLNSHRIENYFCPEDNCEEHVLELLNNAQESVYFMTFSFTSDPIGDFLISKKDVLEVRGVFEKSQNNQWLEYHKMIEKDMNVRWDGNSANMHHKVFIIDEKIVITGSYNPTNNGNKNNDENVLVFYDPEIVQLFIDEFESVWETAVSVS